MNTMHMPITHLYYFILTLDYSYIKNHMSLIVDKPFVCGQGLIHTLFTGVSDEKRADAHKFLSTGSDMSQEFKADGENWTLTTCSAGRELTVSFSIGKEFDSMTLDGRKIKVKTR